MALELTLSPIEKMNLAQLTREKEAYEFHLSTFSAQGCGKLRRITKQHLEKIEELIKQRKLENLLKGE